MYWYLFASQVQVAVQGYSGTFLIVSSTSMTSNSGEAIIFTTSAREKEHGAARSKGFQGVVDDRGGLWRRRLGYILPEHRLAPSLHHCQPPTVSILNL
jgi:hypothetical protein